MKTIKTIVSVLVALVALVLAIKYRKTLKNKAIEATKKGKDLSVKAYAWIKEAK